MSTKAIYIVLTIALALAGVTFLVMTPRPAPKGLGPIVWLASLAQGDATVESMRVEWDGAPPCDITRAPTGDWLLSSGDGRGPWPIGPAQLRGALRLLANHAGAERASGPFTSGGAKVTIRTREHGDRHLEFSPDALGGQGRARVDSDPVQEVLIVDVQVRDLFTRDGLLAWRKGNAFPREGLDPTRITIESPTGEYSAGSIQGNWALQSPVVAPASKEQIASLKTRLGALTLTRIVDGDSDDPAFGFAEPWGVIGLETPMRTEGDTRHVLVESLRIGSPADVAGSARFVRATARTFNTQLRREDVLWGPLVAVVEVSKLEAIATAGSSLISKRSTPIAAANVSTVALAPLESFAPSPTPDKPVSAMERVAFKLGVAGWERSQGERTLALSAEQSAEVAGLVRMLAETDATEVSLLRTSDALPVAQVTIQGFGPSDSTTILFGTLPGRAGSEPALITRVGDVDRIYRGPWVVGLAQWLAKTIRPER